MLQTWYNSLSVILIQVSSEAGRYLPRVIAALLILIIGGALAKALKKLVIKVLEAFRVSSAIQKTPVEHFLQDAEFGNKLETIIGTVFYWFAMLVVLHTTVSVLGLSSLSLLLEKILAYLPNIISAVIVLFFGVLLAGLVEGLVKGAIRSIDNKAGRLLGKVASYLVVTIAIMAAISELGIAKEFILILFIGFVTMLALGGGLALGLGGQDVVRQISKDWYDRMKKEVSK